MCASRSIESALDRLRPPPSDYPTTSQLSVPVFICISCTLAVNTACALLECIPPSAPLVLRVAVELCTSMYLVDLISGIVHASLDFADTGDRLRKVIPRSKAEVHHIRRSSPAFMRSSALSQAVWNFQAHHFACYPEHDDQWIETACLATPLLLLTLLQSALGWLAPPHTRVWCATLALGHCVQASHFMAHRRVHEGEHSLPVRNPTPHTPIPCCHRQLIFSSILLAICSSLVCCVPLHMRGVCRGL